MIKQFTKDYLQFTKRDRVAVLVLVVLIFLVILLPYIWPVAKPRQPSPEKMSAIKAQLAALKKDAGNHTYAKEDEKAGSGYYPTKEANTATNYKLFYFDPNTLEIQGWQQLGIRGKTAATIARYVSKGGKFAKPEDIHKIYGLSQKDYTRILPFVKIASPLGKTEARAETKTFVDSGRRIYPVKKKLLNAVIDINTADTSAYIALPGIGTKLAARIVAFREKLGGFYSVKQIAETYGLPDSTFARMQAFLQCDHPIVRAINVNNADANTLKQHPYIRWNIANAIVQYRAQHGNFRTIEDLQQIVLITPEIFDKLKPYIKLE